MVRFTKTKNLKIVEDLKNKNLIYKSISNSITNTEANRKEAATKANKTKNKEEKKKLIKRYNLNTTIMNKKIKLLEEYKKKISNEKENLLEVPKLKTMKEIKEFNEKPILKRKQTRKQLETLLKARYQGTRQGKKELIKKDVERKFKDKDNIIYPKYEEYIKKVTTQLINKQTVEIDLSYTRNFRSATGLLIDIRKKLPIAKGYVANVGPYYFSLSKKFEEDMEKYFYYEATEVNVIGVSDEEYNSSYESYDTMTIELQEYDYIDEEEPKRRKKKEGGFFPYYSKIDFDLTKFQIFRSPLEMKEHRKDDCLIKAFIESGKLDENKINKIKLMVNNAVFPVCKLATLADKNDLKITLHTLVKKTHADAIVKKKYGNGNIEISIGLLNSHYFLVEDVNITSFSINHYDQVKDLEDWEKITKFNDRGYPKRKENSKISSFKVIQLLLRNSCNLLSPILYNSDIMETFDYDKIKDYNDESEEALEYSEEKETKPYVTPKKAKNNNNNDEVEEIIEDPINIYFDFEAESLKGNHKPYAVCWNSEKENIYTPAQIENFKKQGVLYDEFKGIKYATGPKCGRKFLESLGDDGNIYRLIAHCVSYDYRLLAEFLNVRKELERGTRVIYSEATYYNMRLKKSIEIRIVDSYNMISMKLEHFPKIFNLGEIKKEIIPYDLYNQCNANYYNLLEPELVLEYVKKQINSTNKLYSFLNKRRRAEIIKAKNELLENFQENINKWQCESEDGLLDMLKYSVKYCQQDVRLLRLGWEKFQQWIEEVTGLNINDYKTIPSLSNAYLESVGCFDNCYKLAGTPQQFIQKCIVGGRCMSSNNEKYHVIKGKENLKRKKRNLNYHQVKSSIQDFDAVSLYPSAMNRLEGFLKGKPQVIRKNNGRIRYEDIKNYDGYYVKIKVKGIGKERNFPLLSYKNEEGSRCFSNDLKGRKIYVDKSTLEDSIKYQNIKFEIISGYYFNDGFNDKIKDTIKNLFDTRVQKKKEGNKIQEVYKLIMNAAYGKLIMKPIKTESVFIRPCKEHSLKENFKTYRYNNYNSIKCWYKREGLNFIKVEKVKPINDHFNAAHLGSQVLSMSKRIMNEVICTAEDLGLTIYYQDTDSMHILEDGLNNLTKKYKEIFNRDLVGKGMGQFHNDFDSKYLENIHSQELIILGKKSYIDLLDGNIKDKKERDTDFHIRLKGIPNNTILQHASNEKITPIELYKKMFEGEEINFDLTNKQDNKKFKMGKDYTIETKNEFDRKIKF